MHGERLHLSLQYLHASSGHNGPHIRDHGVREDLVDQAVITEISGVRDVLHRVALFLIILILSRLYINTPVSALATECGTLRLQSFRLCGGLLSFAFGSDVREVLRRVVVRLQGFLVLQLLLFVVLNILRLLILG